MASAAVLREVYPYFLANRAVIGKARLPVLNKHTNQVATHVCLADGSVVREAISRGIAAEEPMRKMHNYEKKNILLQIASEIKKYETEFAAALVVEVGKTIKEAKIEVGRAIDTFTIAAEESVRQYGEYAHMDISARNQGYRSITSRFPVGLISMIVPFNFPLNLAAHKIGPAIAVGCPFVLKPSDRTPICTSILGEIMEKCPLPEGAFSILPTTLEDARHFSEDDRIKLLSFTGSAKVGWQLKSTAGKKKVTLELGGNADADINYAADRITFGAFYQAGQSCISVQRVYIHSKIYEQMKQALIERAKKIKRGDPWSEDTTLGPLISENDAKRVEQWVNQSGGKVLVGGKRDGVFYGMENPRLCSYFSKDATILEGVDRKSDLYCKEVFGPVCFIQKFDNFKEAVDLVNDSDFGLQAGVFTKDSRKMFYAYDNLHVGGVLINDIPSARVDSQPYGGIKDSGVGREGLRFAMEDFTELKVMVMKDIAKLD